MDIGGGKSPIGGRDINGAGWNLEDIIQSYGIEFC